VLSIKEVLRDLRQALLVGGLIIVVVASFVISPFVITASTSSAAQSVPIRLSCEGELRATVRRDPRDEKHLLSLVIDLSARTATVQGHPTVPINGPLDEDTIEFHKPGEMKDVTGGSLNRVTGEAFITIDQGGVDRIHHFRGKCSRAQSLF
jgi:hypothetical protein